MGQRSNASAQLLGTVDSRQTVGRIRSLTIANPLPVNRPLNDE
ncbi:hypothetical protein [Numidum massiliense]|nr:hypothetical protein [Numidum massiliense]